jgi:hydrogenase maturation protease
VAERPGRVSRTLVIGIGNDERGDDGAGRLVARLLRGRLPGDVEIVELDGEASALLASLEGAEAVFLVDAAVSGAAPGSIERFDCAREPLPKSTLAVSTHGLGVAEAVELARALGRLPQCCVLYAIEAATVAAGAPLSEAVRASAETVAARIAGALSGRRGWRPARPASRGCGPS